MFIAATLNLEHKTFVVDVALFNSFDLDIYLSHRPQVAGLI